MPVIRAIVEQHLLEASFLWTLRRAAALSPLYSRLELAHLDDRIEAHLDGMRVGGQAAFELVAELLRFEDAGEIFAASQLALSTGALEQLAPALDVGGADPKLRRGVVSALGWTELGAIEKALAALLDPESPPGLLWLGLAGHAVHRRDPGSALGEALSHADASVRARALRSVGELGRVELANEVLLALSDPEREPQMWAAWSATLLGRFEALPALWKSAGVADTVGDRALMLAARASDPATAARELTTLRHRPERARAAVLGCGASGDATSMELAFEAMTDPELARAAGTAFTLWSGLDLRAEGLEADAPEGHRDGPSDDPDDEDVSVSPDVDLPWPDVDRCRARAASLPRRERLLGGKPITAAWLDELIAADVSQALRHEAACARALLVPTTPLFEVRARVLRT